MAEKFMENERKALEKFLRREMPVIAGRMAQDHFQNNFRLGGFVNGGLHPWPKSKRLSSGGTGAAGNYGTLLSERKVLFKSIKYIPADYRVKISNDVVYAPIHNWGDTVHPAVTDKMRKWAWRQFYKSAGIRKNASKKTRASRLKEAAANPQAQMWKGLALTRKKRLSIRIPQRQFIGESEELNEKIEKKITEKIFNILTS